MKYIFRYTLITQYTANPDNLNDRDLISTLKSVNFPQMDKIQPLIQLSRNTIDDLIKGIGKANISAAQWARQTIGQHLGQQYENYADELVQVWENEKQHIIGKIMAQSCRSQDKLSKVTWQVHSLISSRRQCPKQKTVVVGFCTTNASKVANKTSFQLNKSQLNNMVSVLLDAAEFLNLNLK